MISAPTISKNPKLTNDQDYAFLRQTGVDYIEKLGSDQWTDYNEHDPGITIMEALCYAITELGYRTGLPMQDLLTQADGTIPDSQTLYTAKTILTQSPLNVDDYRKLLIDIVGVHNAWMQYAPYYTIKDKKVPAGEVAIFADCTKDELAYYTTPHPIYLSGLYNVLLDLDNDEQFGDLNNGEIQVLNPASGAFNSGTVSMTVVLPVWDDVTVTNLLDAKPESVTVTNVTFPSGSNVTAVIAFTYTTLQGAAATGTLTGIIDINLQPAGKKVQPGDIQGFFDAAFSAQVISLYLMKIQKAKKIVAAAISTLNQNRNLCEDFVSVKTITDEEIAICCDIDVEPSADMEQVQAQVFFAIEEYLDPSVNFYTLADMQGKGYTTDQIFEGPILQHGFIDTAELEQTQLRDEIYGSKIISLIMNIKNVLAVRNFRMTKYDANDVPISTETGKKWCMPITPGCKPVLAETKSKITFYKNQFPYLPSFADVQSILNWMNAAKARNKLSGYSGDIPVPQGTYFPLDNYTSIADLFPRTYGVGPVGLPPSATAERVGQANQLKAYLLFYDQLLADFFSLLDNAKSLFSTDSIVQTYFAQFVDGIKDILPVYWQNPGAKTINELVMQHQDATSGAVNPWQQLYESNDTYLDRRNRFLDHLMSRFAESFNEYVLLMYSLDYTTQQETSIDPADLINSKIQFLKDYPTTSYQRGRAFNYFPEKADGTVDTSQLWETDNVSGAEKKLSSLGGYSNYWRRYLFCMGEADITPTADTPAQYQFTFSDDHGNTLTPTAKYPDETTLMEALAAFMDLVLAGGYFNIKQTGTNWNIYVVDSGGNTVAVSNDFTSQPDAQTSLNEFIAKFNTQCDTEGMHLVEHILLRPRNDNFWLAPVCLDPDCDFCGEQDPYSFRISVVLPYWPPHFQNMAFRSYFENIIRQELPAHAVVKICWLDDKTMYDFDIAYKAWIIALADYAFAPNDSTVVTALEGANKTLLQLIFNMYSQYPVATLHDCDESKNTNSVQLGKTILGSIKN